MQILLIKFHFEILLQNFTLKFYLIVKSNLVPDQISIQNFSSLYLTILRAFGNEKCSFMCLLTREEIS